MQTPFESASQSEQSSDIKMSFVVLPEKERLVVELLFGLQPNQYGIDYSAHQIAKILNCHPMRVGMLRDSALVRLFRSGLLHQHQQVTSVDDILQLHRKGLDS